MTVGCEESLQEPVLWGIFLLNGRSQVMERVLVKTDEYNGRYVAMKSFDDHTIVGVGDDPETALKDAISKGYKEPVLLYIPEKELVHIYLCQYATIHFPSQDRGI
jgi:hypothetical protein